MALAIDASSPVSALAAGGVVVTTASFTPPNGSLLVACSEGDGGAGANPSITITNTGTGVSAWTNALRATKTTSAGTGNGGVSCIDYATITTGSAMTVTSTMGSGALPINLKVYVITGYDTTGFIGPNFKLAWSNVAHTTTQSFLSTRNNSLIICAAAEWLSSNAPTSSDLTIETYFVSGQSRGLSGFKTVAVAGSTVTCDLNCTGADWLYCIVEILPAVVGTTGRCLNAPSKATLIRSTRW